VVADFGEGFRSLSLPHRTVGGRSEDINDLNDIVGEVRIKRYPNDGWGTPRAYLWKSGQPVDLQKQIDKNSGWDVLWNANLINNVGVIAGWGKFDVTDRGFVMIPNEE
jgi:hypothetical protein